MVRLCPEGLYVWREPIALDVDEDGNPVSIGLPDRNLLLAGEEPSAGKSVTLSILIAAATLDPEVPLTLLDGTQVELASQRPRCRRNARFAERAGIMTSGWQTDPSRIRSDHSSRRFSISDPSRTFSDAVIPFQGTPIGGASASGSAPR